MDRCSYGVRGAINECVIIGLYVQWWLVVVVEVCWEERWVDGGWWMDDPLDVRR